MPAYKTLKNCDIEIFRSQYHNTYHILRTNGFIIDEIKDELNEICRKHEIATKGYNSEYSILVYPTLDCNLRCWYCYEDHIAGSFMSDEVQKKLTIHIERRFRSIKTSKLRMTFFGGEPFLHFDDCIYPLLKKTQEICDRYNVELIPFFITNATLITRDVIMKIKPFAPIFQISFDGHKEKHDTVKVMKGSRCSTYKRMLDTLKMISDEIGPRKDGLLSTIRINYDNNTLKKINGLIYDLSSLNKDVFFFYMERVWQTLESSNAEEQVALIKNAIRQFSENGIEMHFGPFAYGKKDYSCQAEIKDFAVINYNGKVYKCNGRKLIEENALGELLDSGDIKWNNELLNIRELHKTYENPKCLNCKFLPLCMGPCSQKQIENNWNDINLICPLNTIGMTINDYFSLCFEVKYRCTKQKFQNDKM